MADNQIDVQGELLRSLLKKIAADPFPSVSMMDTVEELLTPETIEAYAKILLRHVERDNFPSVSMIDRLRNLRIN